MVKGRNSITIGFRISDTDFAILNKAASEVGITPQRLIKLKTIAFAQKLKAQHPQLYDPSFHKPGDRVLIHNRNKLVPTFLPEK